MVQIKFLHKFKGAKMQITHPGQVQIKTGHLSSSQFVKASG